MKVVNAILIFCAVGANGFESSDFDEIELPEVCTFPHITSIYTHIGY